MSFKLNKSNLNLNVYTAPTLPSSGKDNDIVVLSSVPMTNWILSPDEPKSAPRAYGDVFIKYSFTGNTIDILKNGSMLISPLFAKQFVGGEWVRMEAKSYQNGAWVDWIPYFYKDGDTFDVATGGYTLGSSNVTLESDNIRMYCDTQNQTTNFFITKSKVDLSGISTLYIKFNYNVVSSYGNKGKLYFYATENVLSGYDGTTGGGATIAKEYAANTSGEDIVSLDVSSVTGAKYIFSAVTTTGKYTNTTFNIKEIWGE